MNPTPAPPPRFDLSLELPPDVAGRRALEVASKLPEVLGSAWSTMIERVARELGARHPPAAGGKVRVWSDGARVLVQVRLELPPKTPAGPPPSMLAKHARKRAEALAALAKKKPPAPRPWTSGAVEVAAPRAPSTTAAPLFGAGPLPSGPGKGAGA